jgi:type III secretory pathway component EscS
MSHLCAEAIGIFCLLVGIPLSVSALISLCVSVVFAAMQIQEPILPFLIRVSAAAVCIVLCWSWFSDVLTEFSVSAFNLLRFSGNN